MSFFASSLVVLCASSVFRFLHFPQAAGSAAAMRRRISFFLPTLLAVVFVCSGLQILPVGHARLQPRQVPQRVLGQHPDPLTKPSMASFQPPLRTVGRHILDANGQRVKLASVNWYGASDVMFAPMGLDFRHRNDIARTIRKLGFNSVRFPYSDHMVIENPVVDPVYLGANLDLLDNFTRTDDGGFTFDEASPGPRALDVYRACVEAMTDAGLAVIINNHITNAHWCDGKNICDSSWKNDHYGPLCKVRQTTESWIDNWKTVMLPYVDNPLVIGADLRNEPRGPWGTISWDSWATAAEQASEALLAIQPAWLMFVEGIGSANDCSGARDRPVTLSIPGRVVYSAHVYSWSGWSSLVPYGRRPYPSFALDMERNWGFLLRRDVAPVWVGEFGAPHVAGTSARHYWDNLIRYLRETDADWGYWAINPRKPPEYGSETYGLLQDDWETIVEDYRITDLRTLMAKQE